MLLMTVYLWHHNSTSEDSKLLFPFIELLVPSADGDPAALADASLVAFGLATAGFFLWAVWDTYQGRQRALAARDD